MRDHLRFDALKWALKSGGARGMSDAIKKVGTKPPGAIYDAFVRRHMSKFELHGLNETLLIPTTYYQ